MQVCIVYCEFQGDMEGDDGSMKGTLNLSPLILSIQQMQDASGHLKFGLATTVGLGW